MHRFAILTSTLNSLSDQHRPTIGATESEGGNDPISRDTAANPTPTRDASALGLQQNTQGLDMNNNCAIDAPPPQPPTLDAILDATSVRAY